MLHIHVPLFHLLSCNSLLHPQVKLERSRIAPIIPMEYPRRAGKSCPVHRRCSRHRDHPRMGGEKLAMILVACTMLGSPPRGRGKGQIRPRRGLQRGITPAWAGKRPRLARSKYPGQDHPRIGGEKCRGAPAATLPPGSPLRRQGKENPKRGQF